MKSITEILVLGSLTILSNHALGCGAEKHEKQVRVPASEKPVVEMTAEAPKIVLVKQAGMEVFGPPAPEEMPQAPEKK